MILVIGGGGFVGSHMAKLLRETGEPHIVLDSFEKGHRAAIKGSNFVEMDLRNSAAVRQVFVQHEIDVVMHFAAYSLVSESVSEPAKYWSNNVTAMVGLLDIMREFGVSKLVFSSSAAVYGNPACIPICEDETKNPTSPYGQTKLAMEMALASYEDAYGIRSVCLRYFNAAGASRDGSIGEDHRPESHLIPAAIRAAMGIQPPIVVHGTDYPTRDGTCVRDYIHVEDLTQAHFSAINRLRDGGGGISLNLGTGIGWTVKEVLATIAEVTQLRVPQSEGPRRTGDPAALVADPSRARHELGWEPKYVDVRDCIAHAWRWHRDHPHGFDD